MQFRVLFGSRTYDMCFFHFCKTFLNKSLLFKDILSEYQSHLAASSCAGNPMNILANKLHI